MSKYATVYLGSENDVTPVFRDEATDIRLWPAQAVMAVTFPYGSQLAAQLKARLPYTEYYGADGWPVGFPDNQRSLDEAVKRELQVSPHDWRGWTERQWWVRRINPSLLRRGRLQARIAHALLQVH